MDFPPSIKPFNNILLSQPRTCSHLLVRILNLPSQPSIHKHPSDGYFFMPTISARFAKQQQEQQALVPGREISTPEYRSVLQTCIKNVETWLQEVATTPGKGCYIKEHACWIVDPSRELNYVRGLGLGLSSQLAFDSCEIGNMDGISDDDGQRSEGNDTVLSDAMLMEFRPTFLIRHPALTFPSLVRASRDALDAADGQYWEMNYYWSRRLYGWYMNNLSREQRQTATEGVEFPIVLSADDIECPALVEKYAEAVGLDKSQLRWKWDAATAEEVNQDPMAVQRFKDTLMKSQGVIKNRNRDELDLSTEKAKWIEEFGDDIGSALAVLVDKAMGDYEWLRERRMQA